MRTLLLNIILIALTTPTYALDLQVKISGVNKELYKILASNLKLDTFKKNNQLNLNPNKIANIHHKSLKKIKHILAAYGYYNSNVIGTLTEIIPDKIWRSSYNIQVGPSTKISHINLKISGAAANHPFFKHYKINNLSINQVLLHKNYETAKEELLILLQEYGFLGAKYTSSQLRIDRNAHTAEVILLIDSEQQYVFGKTTYINSTLDLAFLNRIIPFNPGEAYTTTKVMALRNNLNAVDLFEKITIDPMPDLINKDNLIVPITISLEPKKNKRYTASLGYGSDTGVRTSLGWQHRRVTDTGHKITASLNHSKIRKKGQLNYIIPGKQPATDSYVINTILQETTIDDIYYRKAEVGFSTNKNRENNIRIWSTRRLIETFKDLQQDKNINVQFLLGEAYYSFSTIEKQAEREYGHKTAISIIAASRKLLSTTNLLKLSLDNKFVFPLVADFRLILQNSIGCIATPNFSTTPMSLRYFAGGPDSIRGFKLDSIGQKELNKNGITVNIGGKKLFLFSTEIDKPIWEKISAAIFVDTGSAGHKFTNKLSTGAGIGLRWNTQIGSLKFDIAKPISKIKPKKLRFNISFGNELSK